MHEVNWDTYEVINWLINDEEAWNTLQGWDAEAIKEWVIKRNAPQGLYDSFHQPPLSSLEAVDWKRIAEAITG